MIKKHLISPLALTLMLAACHKQAGGPGALDGTPLALSYGTPLALFTAGVPAPALDPIFEGNVEHFEVSPGLPAGLMLDAATGRIAGTPTAPTARASYRITASGPTGSDRHELVIGVERAARFAYSVNQARDAFSLFTVNAASGQLGFHGLAPNSFDERNLETTTLDEEGTALFATSLGNSSHAPAVSHYAIDAVTGRLAPRGVAELGAGPHELALHPAGEFMYATAFGADAIYTYRITSTGELEQLGEALTTDAGPTDIEVDPAGRYAVVLNRTASTIASFRIDPATGALAALPPRVIESGTPLTMHLDANNSRLFVTFEDSDAIRSFEIEGETGELRDLDSLFTGQLRDHVALHPTGRFLYCSRAFEGGLLFYEIDAETGALTARGETASGLNIDGIHFDEAGHNAFLVSDPADEIRSYAVDPVTGALTEKSAIRTGSGPVGFSFKSGDAPLRRRANHLYVLNAESEDISTFGVQTDGTLEELGLPAVTGAGPVAIATDIERRFLFVANSADRTVGSYTIDSTTGGLTALGSPLSTAGEPVDLCLAPTGRTLFVITSGPNIVLGFDVDPANGALELVSERTVASGPRSVAIDPTGSYAFTSHTDDNNLLMPRIICSFHLVDSELVGEPAIAPAPGHPRTLSFSPDGRRVFVALHDADILATYNLNSNTGVLTPVPPGTPTADLPTVVELDPTGRFAYAAISDPAGSGQVLALTVDATDGSLIQGQSSTVGLGPRDLLVAPDGDWLFVANERGDDLSVFAIDPATGALTSQGNVPAGLAPRALLMSETIE